MTPVHPNRISKKKKKGKKKEVIQCWQGCKASRILIHCMYENYTLHVEV